MEKVIATPGALIQLGHVGENGVRQVLFDLSDFSSLGNGYATLVVALPGDDKLYPVPVAKANETAIWTITSAETSHYGYGRVQLNYLVDEKVAKTEIYDTWVASSMDDATEVFPPAPHQSWVNQVLKAGSDAAYHAEYIKAMSESGEFDGGYYTISATVESSTLILNFSPSKSGMIELPPQKITINIPQKLSDLHTDPQHRTVTDHEKEIWNQKPTQGLDGTTFIPEILQTSTGCTIRWSNSKNLPNPPDVNLINGKTPIKGIDYGTFEDKQAIVDEVLSVLPRWKWGAH